PLVGGDRGARGAEHEAAAGRRARLGHRGYWLHPRAWRRKMAAARRRRRARGRGDRDTSEPGRPRLDSLPGADPIVSVDMENLLSIGEFASASRLSPKALPS